MNCTYNFQWLISFSLFLLSFSSISKAPDLFRYFNIKGGDLSNITWAHAVNSRKLLKNYLDDKSVHMIEGDVSLGKVVTGHRESQENVLIMAKPGSDISDVSLEDWMQIFLEEIKKGKRKGMKLHFEDLNVAISALGNGLKRLSSSIVGFPFWLHTNILKGPGAGDNEKIVNSDVFLSLCTEFFPQAILSLGWKTVYEDESLHYNEEMIDQMVKTIKKNNIRQPITFPIRASFDNTSIASFKKLMKEVPQSSFTIWSEPSDQVDPQTLVHFSRVTGKNKAYYDLPPSHMTKFIEARSSSYTLPSNKFLLIFNVAVSSSMGCSLFFNYLYYFIK